MLAMTQAIEAAQTTPVRVETPPPRRGPPPRPNDGTPPAPAQGQAPPLHLDKLRHRLDGDEQALVQLARAMRTDLAQRVDALATAGQQQDRATAMAQAHALKGSLASMTAQRAAALTNGLEMAARSGEWALFSRALPVLRGELDKLDAALAALLPPATP
jgi:HPt (histidine-containing phosphotransfer) domain-containing protein